MDVKKLVPLDGWVTLTGCGLAALYATAVGMKWMDQNSGVEMFIFAIIGIGLGRKGDAAKRETGQIRKEVEDLRNRVDPNESLEDRIRRNQR